MEEVVAEVEPVEAEATEAETAEPETPDLEPDLEPTDLESELPAEIPDEASVTEPVEVPAPVKQVQKISQEALNDAVVTFAQLDNVKLIAAFTETGKSVVSRGDGFDLTALSRLSGMALKLLGKSGILRSYYLAHSEGQLFLFPHGGYTLMVIGNAELNLGLVFATLHKLKEEM